MERMISFAHLTTAQRKTANRIIFLNVVAILSLFFFALMQKENLPVTYSFVLGDEWKLLKEWKFGSKSGSTGFSIAAIVFSVLAFWVYVKRQSAKLLVAAGAIFFFMSFLNWASAGDFVPFTGLLQGGLILSVPLIFGALAGVVAAQADGLAPALDVDELLLLREADDHRRLHGEEFEDFERGVQLAEAAVDDDDARRHAVE